MTLVRPLAPGLGTLARGLPECAPGTLFALARGGGVRVGPAARCTVLFGRDEPGVHVPIGVDDPGMSRRHGLLYCDGSRWTIRNIGIVPIRFPGSQLLRSGHEQPLPTSYTPLFIGTGSGREHLLEIRIVARRQQSWRRSATWRLSARERLVLVALGRPYLRHEAHPRPRSSNQVAAELAELRPGEGWTPETVDDIVRDVRVRLAGTVSGLTHDTVDKPGEDVLNHNLLLELLISTALVPPHLRLLRGPRS